MDLLVNMSKGEEIIVMNTTKEYLQLMSYGIFKGSKIKIIRNDKWQEIMMIELDGKRIALRKEDAIPIQVLKSNDA